MLLNELLELFSISYAGPVTPSSNKNFPESSFSFGEGYVWGKGTGSLAVIKPDLSRNLVEPAAAVNYPASRN